MVLLNMNSKPFFIYEKCLRICGNWPLDGFKSRSVIVYSVFGLLEIVLILSQLKVLFVKCIVDGVDQRFLSSAVFIFRSLLRLTMRLYGRRLIPLIESTIDDWSSITGLTEWRIMKRHDKFGTYPFLILIVWFVVYPCVCGVSLLVFPNTPTALDDQQSCGGNETLMWFIGKFMAFFQIAMKLFENLSHFSSILLFWSLAMHLCGQYHVLKLQFEEFLLMADKKEQRREFRRLVKRHNHLLDLGLKLEGAFNVFLALDLLGVQIFTCIHATELGHAIRDLHLIIMTEEFVYITLNIVYQFLFFHVSDYLTTCGQMIGDVFTQCNWYNMPKESITNFSIVIARSQTPPKFTAFNVYKLSHSNFKYVLNGIYSYVSLIVAITKD